MPTKHEHPKVLGDDARIGPVWWAVGCVILTWTATLIVAAVAPNQTVGTFGDTFGSINALFSGLAFVGLIYAILLQRRELSLQRKEVEDTRAELKGTREAQELQNRYIEHQIAESSLFQMLGHLRATSGAFTYGQASTTSRLEGRECLEQYARLAYSYIRDNQTNVSVGYGILLNQYGYALLPYLRTLSILIKFSASTTDNLRVFALSQVAASISHHDMLLLFYYVLYEGDVALKKIIEAEGLFGDLRRDAVHPEHAALYDPSAFAKE